MWWTYDDVSIVELLVGGERLAKLPPSRHNVFKEQILPAGGRDGEAQRLAGKPGEALPVVSVHVQPRRSKASHQGVSTAGPRG